jgi:hypothetical protein
VAEEPTASDSNIIQRYANSDDFIDDVSEFERLPGKHGAEKSRHFSTTSAAATRTTTTTAIEENDELDDFEKVTMEDCLNKLIRLRNDVPEYSQSL